MHMRHLIYIILICSPSFSEAQYTLSNFKQAQQHAAKDEMGEILLAAAQKFTEKVNVYRKKQRAKPFEELDFVWLMAYNHTLWMRQNNKLEHSQKMGSANFSGKSISDRLKFVSDKLRFGSIGENIAYIDFDAEDIEDLESIPELIADEFFHLWRKSSGHRANMLSKMHTSHGIVMLKSGRRIYSSHVFYSK